MLARQEVLMMAYLAPYLFYHITTRNGSFLCPGCSNYSGLLAARDVLSLPAPQAGLLGTLQRLAFFCCGLCSRRLPSPQQKNSCEPPQVVRSPEQLQIKIVEGNR